MSTALQKTLLELASAIGEGRMGLSPKHAVRDAGSRAEGPSDLSEIMELFAKRALFPDAVMLLQRNGDVLAASQSATDLAATKCNENIASRLHVQDRVVFLASLDDCASKAGATSVCVRTQDSGAVTHLELDLKPMPVKDAGGAAQTLVHATLRDVSDKVAAEEQLKKKQEKIETESSAKSKFLANMSHELRTPLNAIIGFSELLQSNIADNLKPAKRDEYVGIINGSAQHLLNVLNDILDMSKIEAGKYEIFPEACDLGDLIQRATGILQVQAEKGGVELTADIDDQLPAVTADPRAVLQVLINVLSNAVKFTGENGKVRVFAERIGRRVLIKVQDSGIGMSPENIEKLGEPFYQADSKYDRKYEGTGLGLSVVKGLVSLHGGEVKFESALNVGTTVTIILPIQAESAHPVPADMSADVVQIKSGHDDIDEGRLSIKAAG